MKYLLESHIICTISNSLLHSVRNYGKKNERNLYVLSNEWLLLLLFIIIQSIVWKLAPSPQYTSLLQLIAATTLYKYNFSYKSSLMWKIPLPLINNIHSFGYHSQLFPLFCNKLIKNLFEI